MSQDGLLLGSQCKRQPSHLEVTEWDLYQPALDILDVVFYMFIRGKRRRGRSANGGWGLCLKNIICSCAFYGNSEQTS